MIKNNKMHTMVWEGEKGIPVVRRYNVTWKYILPHLTHYNN